MRGRALRPCARRTREIGLEARFISVVGYLADHILLSGFRVDTGSRGSLQPGL